MQKIKFATIIITAIYLAACSPTTKSTSLSVKVVSVAMPDAIKQEVNLSNHFVSNACPVEMRHVSGAFCDNVIQKCLTYIDPVSNKFARCGKFAPTVCIGQKIDMDFCIDTEEHHPSDSVMPSTDVSWEQASQVCTQEGKQLCEENQWTLACEGNEMYPHTTGYVRPSDKCNFDQQNLLDKTGGFINLSRPITDNAECISPFGVHNMNGNVDEWVVLEHPYTPKRGIKMMSGLKGGWWGGMRDRCRPVTVGHNEIFHELQIGFRCCKSI